MHICQLDQQNTNKTLPIYVCILLFEIAKSTISLSLDNLNNKYTPPR